MSIVGIGIDIIEIKRIKKVFIHFGDLFAYKILTKNELVIYQTNSNNKINFLAKYFVVKEAAVKALNTGFTCGIFFNQIELLHNKKGKPKLRFYNQAFKILKKKNNCKIHVSLSDEKKYTCAIVIIEKA
ncbi:holo-ACP synthase [Enterobacteriaceae endosymbiont of Donacia tomentosa]|uniref:holo-ACP synthase n=1 Tax=Enterobacteriaceae endosymbiont of Donacia tomentosa TaxID=2675787 RepID=UPI001449EF9E|nr:holo-ACP synthase [Enterobacteriaceae endosymbiont of Donacia tomentosa]QJC31612.1 holo-ACP synthase [Enterobacteriaceae endosymbiont of Donacia tomentosa]